MLNISFNFVVWTESVSLHYFHIFQTDLAGFIYLFKKVDKINSFIKTKNFKQKQTFSLNQFVEKFFNLFLLGMNFNNLTVNLNILYVFNMHVKFYSNSILFTIQLIILFFLFHKILKFKYLIDNIKINF